MNRRALSLAIPLTSGAVFLLAIAWPTVALMVRCITQAAAPRGGFVFTDRQFGLLWRTCWLSLSATILCLIVSLPAAYVLGRSYRPAHRALSAGLMMVVLLTPPMVTAFGWQRILPAEFDAQARCVGVWSLWAWPISALLLAAGWRRSARRAHEAATLVSSSWTAFTRVTVPILAKYIALGSLIVFVLFFGDYGVPHACGLSVYATDMLGWAQESSRTIDVLFPAVPGVLVVGAAVGLILRLSSRLAADGDDGAGSPAAPSSGRTPRDAHATIWHYLRSIQGEAVGAPSATIVLVAVSWLLPIGWLTLKVGSLDAFGRAIRTYGLDLGWSFGVALVGAAACIVLGLGLTDRWRRLAVVWSVTIGALPGSLIGVAMIAAYNNSVTYPIYDGWVIIALSYVARFGWIGVLIGVLVTGGGASSLDAQARTDGADDGAVLARVRIPSHLTLLLAGVAVVTALSLADVAASSLVRIPAYNPIAHVLIEKYHRFEDGMLVSLSLWLTAAVIPAAGLLGVVMKRRGGR